jgi:ParB-like chromosome segregation protein Spo0J
VLLYDATRDDDVDLGAVIVTDPQAVERLQTTGSIEAVSVEAIADSPSAVREITDADYQQFVREVNERGHLLSYPTVRPQPERANAYDVVSSHRRVAAVRRAALDILPVRIVDLDG